MLVDHPATRHSQRPNTLVLFVVVVALIVCADQPATAQGIEAGTPRIAAPPGEDFAENAHADLVRSVPMPAYAIGDDEMSRCATRGGAARQRTPWCVWDTDRLRKREKLCNGLNLSRPCAVGLIYCVHRAVVRPIASIPTCQAARSGTGLCHSLSTVRPLSAHILSTCSMWLQ